MMSTDTLLVFVKIVRKKDLEKMNPKTLHKISYGLYVICSKNGEKINGQIANALFQVTSKPPTIAVSINKQNLTHDYIEKSNCFTVSILSEDASMNLIGNFGFKSGRNIDKFEKVKYKILFIEDDKFEFRTSSKYGCGDGDDRSFEEWLHPVGSKKLEYYSRGTYGTSQGTLTKQ